MKRLSNLVHFTSSVFIEITPKRISTVIFVFVLSAVNEVFVVNKLSGAVNEKMETEGSAPLWNDSTLLQMTECKNSGQQKMSHRLKVDRGDFNSSGGRMRRSRFNGTICSGPARTVNADKRSPDGRWRRFLFSAPIFSKCLFPRSRR